MFIYKRSTYNTFLTYKLAFLNFRLIFNTGKQKEGYPLMSTPLYLRDLTYIFMS